MLKRLREQLKRLWDWFDNEVAELKTENVLIGNIFLSTGKVDQALLVFPNLIRALMYVESRNPSFFRRFNVIRTPCRSEARTFMAMEYCTVIEIG